MDRRAEQVLGSAKESTGARPRSLTPVKRRNFLIGVAALGVGAAAAPLLAACQTGPATGAKTKAPAAGGVRALNAAIVFEPGTVDPATGTDNGARCINRNVYEPLVDSFGADPADLKPVLATSWKISPDGKTYTFSLREGVTFHDGTRFDADAVKFSFDRILKMNQGFAWMLQPAIRIDVVDSRTISLVLDQPFAPFLSMLTFQYIVSPTAVKANAVGDDLGGKWMQSHAIGTGPYKLESWSPGQKLTLVKNDGYWKGWDGKRPERVTALFIKESTTARLMLEKGELDINDTVAVDDLAAYDKNPNLTVYRATTPQINFVMMNNLKGITKDKRIRQAIAYAFDYDAYNKLMKGEIVEADGPFPQDLVGGVPGIKQYKRDLAKAKDLLKQAGYPEGGFTIEATYITGLTEEQKLLELVQANAAELNIKVQVNNLTFPLIIGASQKLETALPMYAWYLGPTYPDPDAYLYQAFYSKSQGTTGRNFMYYQNPTVDDLIVKGRAAQTRDERNQLYRTAAIAIMEDCPGIVVNRKKYQIVTNNRVKGYVFHPMYQNFVRFYDLQVEG